MFRPGRDEILYVRGRDSFLIAGQAGSRFALCIEAPGEELCQFIEPWHIIVVSAPEGGSLCAAAMLFLLVRDHHVPLVVLPRAHPGSRRLRYVVSAGDQVLLSCSIERGTHPEQHLLCSSAELAGVLLTGDPAGICISALPPGISGTVVPLPVACCPP
ncbi:MAG: alpha/beta hydrolase [Methanolinea sp.]|nr:alpha/beta hydrolase [Methanolinea sp.]